MRATAESAPPCARRGIAANSSSPRSRRRPRSARRYLRAIEARGLGGAPRRRLRPRLRPHLRAPSWASTASALARRARARAPAPTAPRRRAAQRLRRRRGRVDRVACGASRRSSVVAWSGGGGGAVGGGLGPGQRCRRHRHRGAVAAVAAPGRSAPSRRTGRAPGMALEPDDEGRTLGLPARRGRQAARRRRSSFPPEPKRGRSVPVASRSPSATARSRCASTAGTPKFRKAPARSATRSGAAAELAQLGEAERPTCT